MAAAVRLCFWILYSVHWPKCLFPRLSCAVWLEWLCILQSDAFSLLTAHWKSSRTTHLPIKLLKRAREVQNTCFPWPQFGISPQLPSHEGWSHVTTSSQWAEGKIFAGQIIYEDIGLHLSTPSTGHVALCYNSTAP